MAARIAINGFGRIGRQCLRFALKSDHLDVVAINDLDSPETMVHLFKHDSIHIPYSGKVGTSGGSLNVDGKSIKIFSERDATKLPWKSLNVDIVLECSGQFRKKSLAQQHIKSGAKRVIVSAPCSDADKTIVMGINETEYDAAKHLVVSNASCTTNCLALVIKVLEEHLGIEHAFMTTVHSYTNDQRLLDGPHSDLRRARAAALSMIPTTSGATQSIVELYPQLKGRMEGLSIRVPTPNVSLVDLVAEVKKDTSVSQLNDLFKKVSAEGGNRILGVTEEPLVSCDFNGDRRSAIVDLPLTHVVKKRMVKIMAWYDNEVGFSQRMIDVAEYLHAH